jgi:uncharacterized protein (TIGR03435 family)
VVDATNLKGAWDLRVDWTPLAGGLSGLDAAPGAEFDTGATIFRTMEKNLGLKLEQRAADADHRHRPGGPRSD